MTLTEAAERFLSRLKDSLADDTFVRLVMVPRAKGADDVRRVEARLVHLRGGIHLSFTFRQATRDLVRNLELAAAQDWIRRGLGQDYTSAWLSTTQRDWQFVWLKPGVARLIAHPPKATTAPDRGHDLPKVRLLDDSARDWLHALGIVDAAGRVRAGRADKHRQIHRYLELLGHLAQEVDWGSPRELVLADMGSGKGYLTFGAWHWFHRVQQFPVRVLGIEARSDLVDFTNRVARQIAAEGLQFITGKIETAELPPVDALIALHACDTATDHAILRGIDLGARLILTAPCCHHEVRPQLGQPLPLAPVLRQGIMAERMAEWVTDGLRALFLEWAGYRVKLFEFIPAEHTPKNLMIAAIRESPPFVHPDARDRIRQLKSLFGVQHQALDRLLQEG